jgi:DNA-binding response OmpR family regulator
MLVLVHTAIGTWLGADLSLPRILSISFDNLAGVARNGTLAQAGYAVSPATSTTRAFELLNEMQFELVIIGAAVPVAERRLLFLEIDRKWGTPVLLVDSGEADPMIRARAHLRENATHDEMLAAVAAVIPQKKAAVKKTPND